MDRSWGQAKDHVCVSRRSAGTDEEADRFVSDLQEFANRAVLRQADIL
jgi:hypothetical protein